MITWIIQLPLQHFLVVLSIAHMLENCKHHFPGATAVQVLDLGSSNQMHTGNCEFSTEFNAERGSGVQGYVLLTRL